MKYLLVTLMTIFAMACSNAESKGSDVTLSVNNTITLEEDFNQLSTASVMQEAMSLDAKLPKGKPIYLILETPGGEVEAGQNMINMLNGLGRPIHTITLFSASMGFQTVQNLGDRLVLPSGMLMSHHARGGAQGEFGGSKDSQLDKRVKMMTDLIGELDRKTVERTKGKKTLDQYQAEYENELWISGENAVKEGYADKVVLPKCDRSLNGTKVKETTVLGIVKIGIVSSKCPMVRGALEVQLKVRTKDGWKSVNEFEADNGVYGYCPVGPVKVSCLSDPTITRQLIDQKAKEVVEKTTLDWKKANILRLNTFKL